MNRAEKRRLEKQAEELEAGYRDWLRGFGHKTEPQEDGEHHEAEPQDRGDGDPDIRGDGA